MAADTRSAVASAPSSAASPAVSCVALTKEYAGRLALDHLSLEVPAGRVLGLLGPNGAGKTTLIRILLGLVSATSGAATVLGERVPSKTVLPRIGYMPQNLAVYTDLKVRQNLQLFGRLYGLSGSALTTRVAAALELVHLAERREARVSELSGGMQRRVSLAGAVLADPNLLLLDEPTVGVDPELRAEFWSYFHRLAAEGRTVVMTTHYMEEATQCDSVVLLHEGAMLCHEPPQAVKARTGTSSMDDAFLVLVREKSRGAQ